MANVFVIDEPQELVQFRRSGWKSSSVWGAIFLLPSPLKIAGDGVSFGGGLLTVEHTQIRTGKTARLQTYWEDPRLDREMLALQFDSRVVMITSAGCNALDYLLDDPAEIHAIDIDPRQNALLELKMAVIQHGNYDELFNMFGNGLRPALSIFSRNCNFRPTRGASGAKKALL